MTAPSSAISSEQPYFVSLLAFFHIGRHLPEDSVVVFLCGELNFGNSVLFGEEF